MIRITGFIMLILIKGAVVYSQSINEEKMALTNFLKRMYTAVPFEGVKIMDDYDNQYLVSVLSLDKSKYPNTSTLMRVAQVKAQSQASNYINGTSVSTDLIIKTTETNENGAPKSVVETLESIREKATGFVNGLELLTNFDIEEGKRQLFMFYKVIPEN
jgi:hypothetical protein